MSEMVERVARAIEQHLMLSEYRREEARNAARAAIKAMREPTEAMKADACVPMRVAMSLPEQHADTWREMIDAALK